MTGCRSFSEAMCGGEIATHGERYDADPVAACIRLYDRGETGLQGATHEGEEKGPARVRRALVIRSVWVA